MQIESDQFGAFTWQATDDFIGDVTETDVTVPTGVVTEPRVTRGIMLNSLDDFVLGNHIVGTVQDYLIDYDLMTSVSTDSSTGQFALADLGNTATFEFHAYDAQGNPFTNFCVVPAPVPEPTMLAGMVASVFVLRRRRK